MRDHAFPNDAFPAIVAHRGSPRTHPENTLPSFEQAVRLGAHIVELDVRLSRDGVAVVMHDATVDRTTDDTGAVHELTASELARLNAGTPEEPAGVPALADVLDLLSGRAAVALEIKHLAGEPAYVAGREDIVEATLAELERTGFDGPALVLSFNPSSIGASKAIAPAVPTGLLLTDPVAPRDALDHAVHAGHDMVLPSARSLVAQGEPFVHDVHAAGLRIGTWTVDDPAEVRLFLDRGVDAVASNDLAVALAVLAGRRS